MPYMSNSPLKACESWQKCNKKIKYATLRRKTPLLILKNI
jgi:hypothetical protein